MRNALEGCGDAFVARAGEIFYRPQRVALQNGAAMLADAETVERHEVDLHASPLLAMFAGETADLDVLKPENADGYWARSDAFDMVFELGGLNGGRRALATALERWVRQILGLEVEIEPLERMDDGDVRWIVGLDAEATRLGNALWQGDIIADEEASRPDCDIRHQAGSGASVLAGGRRQADLSADGPGPGQNIAHEAAKSGHRPAAGDAVSRIKGLVLMAQEDLIVGVVVERRTLDNPWIDHTWLPSAILPGAPAVEAWTALSEQDGVRQVYAGPHTDQLFLHRYGTITATIC